DNTIETSTPGSGASRMQLVSDGAAMYRIRVRAKAETDAVPPAPVSAPAAGALTSSSASISFVASGDDGMTGKVAGYEIRVRVGDQMTAVNFKDSEALGVAVAPADPGTAQTFDIRGLLPETDYWVGIRPYDNCFNRGEL